MVKKEKKKFRMIFYSSVEVYGDYDGVMQEDILDTIQIKQMAQHVNNNICCNCNSVVGCVCR